MLAPTDFPNFLPHNSFHRKKLLGGAGYFGAHVFPVEACSGASETRGNEWAQDTRRHSFNGLTSKTRKF